MRPDPIPAPLIDDETRDALRAARARGHARAAEAVVGRCAFQQARGVSSELEAKRQAMAEGRLTFHAQIGFRRFEDSLAAWRDVHDRLAADGIAPDRYGLCLDWSMGYAPEGRARGQRGTGLVLDAPERFRELTAAAPVAPHFGDFAIGFPGAVDVAEAAVAAGCTTLGNLAQYYTFRLPGVAEDVSASTATAEALGLLAGLKARDGTDYLIHANLDDGYAAWFEDISSALGFAAVERAIVEDGFGLALGHCFGHTYSQPVKRLAFLRALARVNPTPGTMVYGATVLYRAEAAANYGALASYLLVDLCAQIRQPTGHAMTPIPVTEAQRIPSVDEVVDCHRAARALADRAGELAALIDEGPALEAAAVMERRAEGFARRLTDWLCESGCGPVEAPEAALLALRRLGPAELEARFADGDAPPETASPFVDEIAEKAQRVLDRTPAGWRQAIARRKPVLIVAATDVHFYSKRLVETVSKRLDIEVVDGGVSAEVARLADLAAETGAVAIALATYNGIALSYVQRLRGALAAAGVAPALFVGGRLNEIVDDTPGSGPLPVDVSAEIAQLGARPCASVEEMLAELAGQPREEAS